MTTQRTGKETTMTVPQARNQPAAHLSTRREKPAPGLHRDSQETAAGTSTADTSTADTSTADTSTADTSTADASTADTSTAEEESSTSRATQSEHASGDPRALLAARLLAAAALLVTLGQGQLFFMQAVASAIIAMAMILREGLAWIFAVVLSGAGLVAILASVYFPITAVGPFPAINEPTWLLSKAISALAELTVIALWIIRQIAPPSPPS
jgi:hypothetical protein